MAGSGRFAESAVPADTGATNGTKGRASAGPAVEVGRRRYRNISQDARSVSGNDGGCFAGTPNALMVIKINVS